MIPQESHLMNGINLPHPLSNKRENRRIHDEKVLPGTKCQNVVVKKTDLCAEQTAFRTI